MRAREQRVVECPTPQLQALDGAMDTLYVARRGERLRPLATRRRYTQLDGGQLSHSGLQREPGRPLVTARGGGSTVKSHSELHPREGEGEGAGWLGG